MERISTLTHNGDLWAVWLYEDGREVRSWHLVHHNDGGITVFRADPLPKPITHEYSDPIKVSSLT
jgi:hypothetical protein